MDPITRDSPLPSPFIPRPLGRAVAWRASVVHYELLRQLSEGGMAEVFLAREIGVDQFEKLVAIKRILPALAADPAFVSMLALEARVQAHLTHANIVQVFELGRDHDGLYLVMEYVNGADVRQLMQQFARARRSVPLGFACRVVADTLAGLQHTHESRDASGSSLGLVHRDVSPPNIMVTRDGIVKLLDFGIVKSNLVVTTARQMKGKFAYMSPEQIATQQLDGRSDVFAVGAILWELLRGFPLFARETVDETIRAILEAPIPPLSDNGVGVLSRIDEIIRRALTRDRDQRYRSAEAMRADLEQIIREERLQADGLTVRRTVLEILERDPSASPMTTELAGVRTTITLLRRTLTATAIESTVVDDDTTAVALKATAASAAAATAVRTRTRPRSVKARRLSILIGVSGGLFFLTLAITYVLLAANIR